MLTCKEASLHSSGFGRLSQLVQSYLLLQDDNCWFSNWQLNSIGNGQSFNADRAGNLE